MSEPKVCPIRAGDIGPGGSRIWCGVEGCRDCFDPTWCYVCDRPEELCSEFEGEYPVRPEEET